MSERQDVERILDALRPLPRPRAWPALVMLVGAPGTGKTTLAQRLAERTPVALLVADEVRRLLVPAPDFSFEETRRVQRAIRQAAAELLGASVSTVVDAPNLTEWERQPLYGLAALHRARLLVIEVTSPTRVVLSRLEVGATASVGGTQTAADVHRQMAQRQEPITREHVSVDTSSPALEQFVAGLALDLDEG